MEEQTCMSAGSKAQAVLDASAFIMRIAGVVHQLLTLHAC